MYPDLPIVPIYSHRFFRTLETPWLLLLLSRFLSVSLARSVPKCRG
jgi:hypothetical protein